jgi:hypothetical protein
MIPLLLLSLMLIHYLFLQSQSNLPSFLSQYDPAKRSSAAYVPISPDAIELLFVIQDSGIGIPAHALDRIFEPFEQSDTSSIRKYGGTGLGLSICARLVQCMGGKIWAESEQENGSTFSFTIMALASNMSTNLTRRDPGHNYVNMNGGGTGGDSETESSSPSASQRKSAASSGTGSRIAQSSSFPSPEAPSLVIQSINPKSIAAVSARLASMGSLLNVSGTVVESVKDHSSQSILVAEVSIFLLRLSSFVVLTQFWFHPLFRII